MTLEPQLEPEQPGDGAFLSLRRTVADLKASGIQVDFKHVRAEQLKTVKTPDLQKLMRAAQGPENVSTVDFRPAGIVMAWSPSALAARNKEQSSYDEVVDRPTWEVDV